jgi:hypothetical protein
VAFGKVQHLLDPLQVRRQAAAVAAPLGARLVAPQRIVVARRWWSGWRYRESQGQLPGVDALGTLAEAGPAQIVNDLLQRRDACLGGSEGRAQLGYVVVCITAADTILGHAGMVADALASGQVKAGRRSITLP